MVVATTLLYAVLGTIIWEMLESWGKLYTSCVGQRKYHDNWLHSLLIASAMNGQRYKTGRPQNPLEPVTKHTFSGCVKFPLGQVTPDKLVSFLESGEKS